MPVQTCLRYVKAHVHWTHNELHVGRLNRFLKLCCLYSSMTVHATWGGCSVWRWAGVPSVLCIYIDGLPQLKCYLLTRMDWLT